MASYNTSELRIGLKILVDNEPHVILESKFTKPGKGQAFHRVKLRNLSNGRVIDRTYKSGKSIEKANVHGLSLQYLYTDREAWYFMDTNNYQQYTVSETAIADVKEWLQEGTVYGVTLYNGIPLIIEPPNFLELKVVKTEANIRGNTATGGSKSAQLESGLVIKVPLFIEEGEILRIDTRTKEYLARVQS